MDINKITQFKELFVSPYIFAYLSICLLNSVLLLFAMSKFLLAFQQSRYKVKPYLKWINSRNNGYMMRLGLLCLLAFMFFCVLAMTFSSVVGAFASSFVGFASYILFSVIYINTERHVNVKLNLKITKRLVRLCITFFLLIFIASFGIVTLSNFLAYIIKKDVFSILMYSLFCISPLIAPFILIIANYINYPIENAINKSYVQTTKNVLNKANIIKIGITGSYGKTTVKKVLDTILSQKFRVLSTPESYNTPLGISLTVKNLDSTHDVFIAEMGARNRGDIADLTEIVKPHYAVLTGVNSQHLETFRTEENIKETKFELFEHLSENGKGFFSSDNKGSKELYEKFNGEKYLAGLDGQFFVYASDVKTDENGVTFNMHIEDNEPIQCSTTLLGKHNISNICLASAVAYKVGLTPQEIKEGINRLKSVSHRLEIVRNNKDITIIDDSYNSNEDGAMAALEVLKEFSGRKIVLTPGLIELGKRENIANYEFGKELATVADKVIIIGKHNAEMIIKGLFDAGKTGKDVMFAKNLQKGNDLLNEIMKKGDVVLFENDLPDTYN